MLAFMCTKHTLSGVGDVCENHTFFCTLLTFWPDCYYFHGEFWHSKVFMCTRLFVLGGVGLRECIVCTLMKMLTFLDDP